MPDWSPNWADVRFDHGAATAAVDQCLAAARVIDESLAHRLGLRGTATAEWRGRFRQRFDAATTTVEHQLVTRAGELRWVAAQIRAAAAAATAEQARRVAARDRWHDEGAAEAAAALTATRA